ncbi:unnamed protein product [Spirodela intermedia]|uniref:Uncharacterized protein n=1 Tax=Spirodela intermedia TaxID=51605 RepID=A0A7I8JF88_SPIIN|nr:unnamed protein product [Spirodela intermedia]CAA6668820.1 unnamed protein product [Spirodela intermedia]
MAGDGPSSSVWAAMKAALADGILTFAWVFCASTLRASTHAIGTYLGLLAVPFAPIVLTTTLVAFLVFVFTLIGSALGGAVFNPTALASFYAAGLGDNSLFSMSLRFPAQVSRWVLAIMEYMPPQYKHMLGGPTVRVDMHTGAVAEGILTFIISFAVLCIVVKGPRNRIFKTWMLAIATVALVIAGGSYTGPAMNPANAFGWAYVDNRHNTWEQFYVYWICPFIGAILAAWIFRAFFPPPAKEKKA